MNGDRSSGLPFLLAGLGTGIALAFLVAPLKGAAMRSLIARNVKDGEDWVKGKAVGTKEYVRTQGERLRDRVKVRVEADSGS